jgi:hypothetical protein
VSALEDLLAEYADEARLDEVEDLLKALHAYLERYNDTHHPSVEHKRGAGLVYTFVHSWAEGLRPPTPGVDDE